MNKNKKILNQLIRNTEIQTTSNAASLIELQNSNVLRIKRVYNTPYECISGFNPFNIQAMREQSNCKNLLQSTIADIPTLKDIELAYSNVKVPLLLIEANLVTLNDLLNLTRMNEIQITDCAKEVYKIAYNYNLYEFNEFLNRCKTAHYNPFFGSIDTSKIITDLREFDKDLFRARKRAKQAFRDAEYRKAVDTLKKELNAVKTYKEFKGRDLSDIVEVKKKEFKPTVSKILKEKGII